MDDLLKRLREALQMANARADATIGKTRAKLAGRTEAGERLREFVNRDLAPAIQRLEQDVMDQGGDLTIVREYNDPTQYRYAIEGTHPEPNRETFRATLAGTTGHGGQVRWALTLATGDAMHVEVGSAKAICDAILERYIQAIEGS
jgi:hypothetical protein